jgi:hypothetical protein
MTSNCDPPDLCLWVVRIIGVNHQHPARLTFFESHCLAECYISTPTFPRLSLSLFLNRISLNSPDWPQIHYEAHIGLKLTVLP